MSTPFRAVSTSVGEVPLEFVAGEVRSGCQEFVVVRVTEGTPEAVLIAWRSGCLRLEIAGAHFALIAARTAEEEFTDRLTERELQIAVHVSQGLSNKLTACRLGISEWTVATHLRRIFAKLKVTSRAEMVYRCAPLIGRAAGLGGPAASHQRLA